jgi:hypothetical protein
MVTDTLEKSTAIGACGLWIVTTTFLIRLFLRISWAMFSAKVSINLTGCPTICLLTKIAIRP